MAGEGARGFPHTFIWQVKEREAQMAAEESDDEIVFSDEEDD